MGKKEKRMTVYKSNDLVREARYKLTANEQKLILFAISKIKKDDTSKTYKFHIKDFTNYLEISEKSAYRTWYRAMRAVFRKPIVLSMTSGDEKRTVFFSWFSSAGYVDNKGIIFFRFSEELVPHLFNLKKNFTSYDIKKIMQFSSTYSIRIFELLQQGEWKGGIEIPLQELREVLGVADKYTLYGDFKKAVLEVARKDLLKSAGIKFTYREIKEKGGKKVVALFLKGENIDQEGDE